ncbi:hypothetical protein [Algicola sagamiensis]|uniref:hypothetical protein n=1 Tax=Algicola sagamiensis TaxID=163869 RepID=UPI00035C1B41|nr:hypothetical protein [Algicola sagamiensis]
MRQVNEALYTTKNGEFYHPDIPADFDYQSLKKWSESNGIELQGCWMDESYEENLFDEISHIRKWKPVTPNGYTLLAKFHDEDGNGPYAYFGKKVEGETCQS